MFRVEFSFAIEEMLKKNHLFSKKHLNSAQDILL